MPTIYTNNSLDFADEKAPTTYTVASYSFVMETIFKSSSDATGQRKLWLSSLTGSGSVNRFIYAVYDAVSGWDIVDDDTTLTPTALNTAMQVIPPNMVGASITAGDFDEIVVILDL